jgi:hypothetical protein
MTPADSIPPSPNRRLLKFFASNAVVEQRGDGGGVFRRLKGFAIAAGLTVAVISSVATSSDALAADRDSAVKASTPIVKIHSPEVIEAYRDVAAAGFADKISIVEDPYFDTETIDALSLRILDKPSVAARAYFEADIKVHRIAATPSEKSERNDPDYECAVFTSASAAADSFPKVSGMYDGTVPKVDPKFILRFFTLHEIGHCLAGVDKANAGIPAKLNTSRRNEMRADAFAAFREIQRGTPQEALAAIADARLAGIENRFTITHDTGEMFAEIVANYDALRANPKFMSATVPEVIDMSRNMADKYDIDDVEFMKRIQPMVDRIEEFRKLPRHLPDSEKADLYSKSQLLTRSAAATQRLQSASGVVISGNPAAKDHRAQQGTIDAWLETQMRSSTGAVPTIP